MHPVHCTPGSPTVHQVAPPLALTYTTNVPPTPIPRPPKPWSSPAAPPTTRPKCNPTHSVDPPLPGIQPRPSAHLPPRPHPRPPTRAPAPSSRRCARSSVPSLPAPGTTGRRFPRLRHEVPQGETADPRADARSVTEQPEPVPAEPRQPVQPVTGPAALEAFYRPGKKWAAPDRVDTSGTVTDPPHQRKFRRSPTPPPRH